MTSIEEIIKVKYKGHKLFGYLSLNEEHRTIEILVENKELRLEMLKSNNINLYCTRINGIEFSLFDCHLFSEKRGGGYYNLTLRVGTVVETYKESLNDISSKVFTASYPNINSLLPINMSTFEVKPIVIHVEYKNMPLEIKLDQHIKNKRHNNQEITSKGLDLTISLETEIVLEEANEIFQRVDYLLSFIFKSYISYEYIYYQPDIWPIKIYQSNQYSGNKANEFDNNYGILSYLGNIDKEKLFKPINSPVFHVWELYTATLRTTQLIETKYLDYARGLEILARHYTTSEIYGKNELRSKRKKYKKLVNNMDLNIDYKNNLKNLFIYSNRKPFKSILKELLLSYKWNNGIITNFYKNHLDDFASNVVLIRDHLTHGKPYKKLNYYSVIYYLDVIHEFLVAFILKEHHFDYEMDYLESIKSDIPIQQTKLMILLRKFRDIPSPINKNKE